MSIKIKPTLPKGMRDFGPKTMAKRNYIIDVIKGVFKKYGFQQIETPAMENLSTLTGKYGEEGDKLLFKVLNSGDFLAKANDQDLQSKDSRKVAQKISEKGLHYDLTVPFARFVAANQNDIEFPFKRYQIQPVWRADRPQKGRYREFWQCDADVIGSDSLINDTEFVWIYAEVFNKLGIDVTIRLNNRKILQAIAEYIGETEKLTSITIIIDKLDKIGREKMKEEFEKLGLSIDQISKLEKILFESTFEDVKEMVSSTQSGPIGFAQLEEVGNTAKNLNVDFNVNFDISLARGLDYYTSTIYEVEAKDVLIGSIASGGRYDDLTELFGMPNMSGVGISFGLDRIYDVMEELNLFPNNISESTKALFINFDEAGQQYCLLALIKLRDAGIASELYPDQAKMKKQMKYANDKNIPFVILAGSDEIDQNKFTLKNMESGDQQLVDLIQLIAILKSST